MTVTANPIAPEPPVDLDEQALRLKHAALLWVMGVIGGVAVMPYALALQADMLRPLLEKQGLTLFKVGLIGVFQTAVLVLLAVPLGLWAARRVGWKAPVSEALLRRQPIPASAREGVWSALVLGTFSGAAIVALDLAVFLPRIPKLQAINRTFAEHAPLSSGVLACLYGAITEELLLRLFVMSLIGLLLKTLVQSKQPEVGPVIAWLANLSAALLFGLGHLPAAKLLLPLTPLLIVRTLLLNGIVGVLCGWLYARRGLELAMLAHGCADVVLHVITPLLVLSGLLSL
jgi:membrane protease YdiL (CAAX protease family)